MGGAMKKTFWSVTSRFTVAKSNRVSPVVLLAAWLLSSLPASASMILGFPPDAGAGNCDPFGCAYADEYQQVYTHSLFSGPITITGLQFFNTQFNSGATAMNSGTWNISLSTTSADWNSLSETFASNLGADNSLVFSGNLSQPWAFGDTLTIDFTTPFSYDPAKGNLLMDVLVSGASDAGGDIYFDMNGFLPRRHAANTIMGRVFCFGGLPCRPSGSFVKGVGLVTGLLTTPEPASFVLLGLGLLGFLGIAAVRDKRSASV